MSSKNYPQGDENSKIKLSEIISYKPRILTKQYHLDENEELVKSSNANLSSGHVKTIEVDGLKRLAEVIASLRTNQALTYGLPRDGDADLTTKNQWHKKGKPKGVIPRTNETFVWPDGPAVFMIDFDPPKGSRVLGKDQLVGILRKDIPGLANAEMLWVPSSSSHITDTKTGNDLTGLRGQRIYIIVANGTDVPRTGAAINEYLWAAGHGYYTISKSGQLLERTPIDSSVYQPSRLDFAAGAHCEMPLIQNRGEPVIIPGEIEIQDSEKEIPDPSSEIKKKAESARKAAKLEVEEEAAHIKNMWLEERADQMVGVDASDTEREICLSAARRAIENKALSGNFPIMTVDFGGEQHTCTVSELLDDPYKYDGMQALDPLEPDYDGWRPVAKIYAKGSRPTIHSFAHGGATYRLMRQPSRVELVKGRTHDAVERTLEILRESPETYDHGGSLGIAENGKIYHLDEASLTNCLGGLIQFWRWHKIPHGQRIEVLEDPPAKLVKHILSLTDRRQLRQLEGVITAPTLRLDGSLLEKPGYDPQSKLLLETHEAIFPVSMTPTRQQAEDALDTLFHPFQHFPFVDNVDRGVMLAALLTSVIRAIIPTSPAFGFDAPIPASGKTLLAMCIAVLGGEEPAIWSHCKDTNLDEIRKRLFAALRTGKRAIVWDNVAGILKDAAMASYITSPFVTDRVLGKSESISLPNKSTILLTGNNLTLAGDMTRRVLKCRIDPKTERPHARKFAFNPLDLVLKNRQRMVSACLTLIRGWLSSGDNPVDGRMASFEEWDDLVRQTVAWTGREIRPGFVADPMVTVDRAQNADPDRDVLGRLLVVWKHLYGSRKVVSREIVDICKKVEDPSVDCSESERELHACLEDLGKIHNMQSARSIGHLLRSRVGQIVDGWCLADGGKNSKKDILWHITETKN